MDVQNDGVSDLLLNSNGLKIGTGAPSSNLHVSGNAIVSDSLAIGTTSANSTLHIEGSLGMSVETVSSNVYLSNNTIVLADTSEGNIHLSLPSAAEMPGRNYWIKKVSTLNELWLTGARIDNSIDLRFQSGNLPFIGLVSQSHQWYITSQLTTPSVMTSADNLVGWWPFNESSGFTAYDHSPNANHITLTGFETSGNGRVQGVLGNGIEKDGIDDRIQQAVNEDLYDLGTTDIDMTVSFWIKSSVTNPYIFHKGGDGGGQGYYVKVNSATDMRVAISGAWGFIGNPGANIVDGSWHHYVLWLDFRSTSTLKIFIDGVETASSSLAAFSADKNTDTYGLTIGGYPGISYNNTIDDFRIYNKALTSDEIALLYNLGAQ